jgi:large conductance mechanosensitive channel
MGMLKEFKEFAMRGNVIDLAVGIVIGSAFGKIVSSLVADILMPPIGALVGGIKFTELKWTISGLTEEAVTINYGNFIQTAVDFLIIAFAIFMIIRGINRFKKKQEVVPAEPAAPPADIQLLTEIRDLLKK